jgi:hypothetical protein
VVLESAFGSTVRDEIVLQSTMLGINGPGIWGIPGGEKEGDAIGSKGKPAWLGKPGADWPGAGPDGPTAMQVCQAALPGG